MNARADTSPAVAGTVTTVVIGAGHSGLAMSEFLTRHAVDHVVLERGEVANAWFRERWDSLRLLTPNWQMRLPGCAYAGPDPDGFMTARDVGRFVAGYAAAVRAPVVTGTQVRRVAGAGGRYRVETSRGPWLCSAVVIATGACSVPVVPACGRAFGPSVVQVTPDRYRRPAQLPEGGVLVVGGSATGLQLAREIQRSGRPVWLSVGEHVRMPRRYRGPDIQWWLQAIGVLDEHYREVDDLNRVRRLPSPQLVGSQDDACLDLNALQAEGVRIAGRLMDATAHTAQFSGSLDNVCALADLKLERLLQRIDAWAVQQGLDSRLPDPELPPRTRVDERPLLDVDLARENIRSVVWATGFRPDHAWLDCPVFDRRGALRHDGGVVDAPGLYALGLPFMRRRKSTFIHGAEDDVRDVGGHLLAYLDSTVRGRSVLLGGSKATEKHTGCRDIAGPSPRIPTTANTCSASRARSSAGFNATTRGEAAMKLFTIRRRNAWRDASELDRTAQKSADIGNNEMAEEVRWIRTYVIRETDGTLGSLCVYEAVSEKALKEHARRVGMPADEIDAVETTVVVREDPVGAMEAA